VYQVETIGREQIIEKHPQAVGRELELEVRVRFSIQEGRADILFTHSLDACEGTSHHIFPQLQTLGVRRVVLKNSEIGGKR
jgi:hypothetical protein